MGARRFIEAVLRHRRLVLASVVLVSLVAAFFASRVRLESSIEIWFLEDDPTLVSYHEFLDHFDADEFGVVAVFADDVFEPEVLRFIDRVTRDAADVPHAHRVLSVTNVNVFRAFEDAVEIGPLVGEIPATSAESRSLRERALANPLVSGLLVSENGRAAGVIVELDPEGNDFEGLTAFVSALRAVAMRDVPDGVEVVLSGAPVFDETFFRYSEDDFTTLGPGIFVLVVVAAFIVFRRVSAALIPLSVVTLATLWIHGVMGALGMKVNIVSTMLAPLVLAIGVADTIHVLSEYFRELAAGKAREEAVAASAATVFQPCLFTSLTTAVGLLALIASDLQPISDFGWVAALGVMFAFLLSVTLVPVILHLVKPPDPAFLERQQRGPLQRALHGLGRPGRWSRPVLATAAVLVAASVALASRIEVGSNPINYLFADDPVRKDFERVDDELGGGVSVEFLVEAPDRGLLDPGNLRRLDDFQQWLETRDAIGRTFSILDALKEVNRVFRDGDPYAAVVPDSRALVAQYYLLMEGEKDFEAFLRTDYATGRITARVPMTAGRDAIAQMAIVEREAARRFDGPELRVEATGFIKLIENMEDYVLDSQITSLSIAFVAICVMMMLLLRSLRLGLFSMIPNLTPVVLGLGIMGALSIPLDPGTAMIASIALGLIVDDSVHFLYRLRAHSRAGESVEASIAAAMDETGRPIVVTTILLAASISILGFGSFLPNVTFGLMTALVVILALVADLVMLPAALIVIRPRLGR